MCVNNKKGEIIGAVEKDNTKRKDRPCLYVRKEY